MMRFPGGLKCGIAVLTCAAFWAAAVQFVLALEPLGPLVAKGQPVDWWFVFKFNAASFPQCASGAERRCIFGGSIQTKYGAKFSQQYVYATNTEPTLREGSGCLGDTQEDPVGATFDQVYHGSYHYVIWNDQLYQDPPIKGCKNSCGGSRAHSKGMLAWDNEGQGFVMQVSTPNWPGSGSEHHQRERNGNTLGCITQREKPQNNVMVSQHFFALRLTKQDLMSVLDAMKNARVVTDIENPQLVSNGGPDDIQAMVRALGEKGGRGRQKGKAEKVELSTRALLISKSGNVKVPPWQMVSALLGGVSLRVASWWEQDRPDLAIPTTTVDTEIDCWQASFGTPGPVEIATSGRWSGATIGLRGAPRPAFNHAKIGVSTSGDHPYAIFGDMNRKERCPGRNVGEAKMAAAVCSLWLRTGHFPTACGLSSAAIPRQQHFHQN
jgi:hypothetical protein